MRFSFEGMRIEGEVFKLNEYASDGELWVDGSNENGIVSLPANHSGDICMELRLSPDFEIVKVYASRMASTLEGDFELEAVLGRDWE